ncbi:hypothetical protein CALCODRAFT_536739, partial [Calocera cornea HHB12733]
LITKTYPHTPKVLGRYHAVHSHLIGDPNAPFVRVQPQTRAYIEEMLRLKVEPREILRIVHGSAYEPGGATLMERDHFVTMRDIKRLQLAVRAEDVRLAHGDDLSTQRWISRLREHHSLFPGIPVGWLLTSNGESLTLQYWLRLFREANSVTPNYVMTDKNQAQISAIRAVFPSATVLLCWWHVLHAWQQHLRIADHPDLWNLLKKWIRIQDEVEFDQHWGQIYALSPPKFQQYLLLNWTLDKPMWSAVSRQDRHIFEEVHTNMHIEACAQGGFEGLNLAAQARIKAESDGAKILAEDVLSQGLDMYTVRSQTDSRKVYKVDMESAICECAAYPRIQFCKHLAAVEIHFPRGQAAQLLVAPNVEEAALELKATPEQEDQPTRELQVIQVPLADRLYSRAIQLSQMLSANIEEQFSDEIKQLLAVMDTILAQAAPRPGSLPAALKLPPNMTNANETAKTLPHRKRRAKGQAQPYAGRPSRAQPVLPA